VSRWLSRGGSKASSRASEAKQQEAEPSDPCRGSLGWRLEMEAAAESAAGDGPPPRVADADTEAARALGFRAGMVASSGGAGTPFAQEADAEAAISNLN